METTQTRTLDAADLDIVRAAVEKANKRAAKIGVVGYTLTTETAEDREVRVWQEWLGAWKTIGTVEQVTVTVTGETPKYEGWSFVATLTWDEVSGQCVTRKVDGLDDITLPHPKDQWCDHCETARARKDTYLLRHDDGSFKQVGSTCLAEFLGVEVHLHLLGFNPYEGVEDNSPRRPQRLIAQSVLADVIALTREFGWVSGKAAYDNPGRTSTRTRIEDAYFDTRDRDERGRVTDGKIARDAIRLHRQDGDDEIVAATITWVRSLAGRNDYELNLQAALGHETHDTIVGGTVEYDSFRLDNLGLVVSAVSGYQRSIERAQEKAAERSQRPASEWIGQPKDKVTVEHAELISERLIDGEWGTTTLLTFRATNGTVVKWFASNPGETTVGKVYTVKGTVKKHETYNDLKSTVLTRCALIPEEVAA